MKRRKKTIVIIAVFLVVALLITGYIRFFNGKPVYFTMGMKDDELIKTTGQKVTYTCEAEILMSDVKKNMRKCLAAVSGKKMLVMQISKVI